MKDVIKKYAKDLSVGDRIKDETKGWLLVNYARRIPLTTKTELVVNGEHIVCDSHTLFRHVYTDVY